MSVCVWLCVAFVLVYVFACLRVCVCVCVCVCACDISALELYKKSELVFAEGSLSCRNTVMLSSFQARESKQCRCVCVCLCSRLCLCVFAYLCVCLCVRMMSQLWNYTTSQNLSSPRDRCRPGILTCFHLFKPVNVNSVCVCVCVCVLVCVCLRVRVCVCVCVWYLSSCRRIQTSDVRHSFCICRFVQTILSSGIVGEIRIRLHWSYMLGQAPLVYSRRM